jgi:LPS export ABC transporter protein LptC
MAFKTKTIRRLILLILSSLILLEIVVLTPSQTEDTKTLSTKAAGEGLLEDNEPTAILDLPRRKVAEYGVTSFKYVSVQDGEKLWKLDAQKAFMYNPEKLVHGRIITAHLYDSNQKETLVTGTEAKYYLNQKDVEIFGNVHTQFPDGFEIWSPYLRYRPNGRHITVPSTYAVRGTGDQEHGQKFEFTSQGLDYKMNEGLVHLPKNARVTLLRSSTLDAQGIPNSTIIESDECVMNRNTQFAYFTMSSSRPLNTRFVKITQPTLFTRARKADLNYGDFTHVLQYLIAYQDVFIKELDPDSTSLRYATGGIAEFDTRKDTVTLSQFPQVYQDEDTATGDLVIFHRDSGVIEIEQSNAYSKGQGSSPDPNHK